MTTERVVDIGPRRIGGDEAPWVVAEAGVNHNGRADLALRLVDAAADAGADAVKFQTFTAEALATPDAPQAAYQAARSRSTSQQEMLRALELPAQDLRACRDRALERGIIFLSTPFDLRAVALLLDLGVPAFKIGSGDLTNLLLLRAVAAHGLPMLISTGMSTLDEVAAAMADIQGHGDPPVVLLQCTSAYPAAPADANLAAMSTLRRTFSVPVGFSDHTVGIAVAVAAAALGAAVIEKHLTLDRTLPGPDHAVSLEPGEMERLVTAVRDAHLARGDGVKAPKPEEDDVRMVARRSLAVTRLVRRGETLRAADLDARRPADGLSPLLVDEVVGRRAARILHPGDALQAGDLDPPLVE